MFRCRLLLCMSFSDLPAGGGADLSPHTNSAAGQDRTNNAHSLSVKHWALCAFSAFMGHAVHLNRSAGVLNRVRGRHGHRYLRLTPSDKTELIPRHLPPRLLSQQAAAARRRGERLLIRRGRRDASFAIGKCGQSTKMILTGEYTSRIRKTG